MILVSLRFWLKEVCFNAEFTWLIRRFSNGVICFRKFINQIDGFINQNGDLSIKLTIYQSNSAFYQSNASHNQVN